MEVIEQLWKLENRRPPRGGRGLKYLGKNQRLVHQPGRPPRGGRGLKSRWRDIKTLTKEVALRGEGVD